MGPTKLCGIVITFVDRAPQPSPDLVEGAWADEIAELNETTIVVPAQGGASSIEANESAFQEPPVETGSCQHSRWKYGYDHPENRLLMPNVTAIRGGGQPRSRSPLGNAPKTDNQGLD